MFAAVGAVLLIWLVLAQGCMTMRRPDQETKEEFAKQGIMLSTATVNIDGHHLHYAKTGSDTLPTLFFVHGTPGSWNAFEHYLADKRLMLKFRMVSIDRPGFGYSDYGQPEHLAKQSDIISPLFKLLDNHKPMFSSAQQ